MSEIDESVLDALRELDTPTVCNALEVVAPERRGYVYTTDPLVCSRPELGSMVGFARTANRRLRTLLPRPSTLPLTPHSPLIFKKQS